MSARILVITYEFSPFPGGQATYAWELARAMAVRGDEVLVAAPVYDAVPEPAPAGVEVRRMLHHQRLRPLDSPRLAALIARERPRAILAAEVRAAMAATPWARLMGVPIVAMFHGSDLHKLARMGAASRLSRAIIRRADALVANSEFSAALAREVMGRPCAAATLGVEAWWLEPAEGGFDAPSLAALGEDLPVVCMVGRLEARKGQLEALAAASLARKNGARFRLVVAGRAVDETYTAAVRAALGPDDLYVGQLSREDIRRLYRRSLCLLSPARTVEGRVEGFGLATLEAAAQGAPSIVTRVGGLPEAVIDGVTGFVAEEGDLLQLSALLGAAVADPAGLDRLRGQAIAHARASNWTRTLSRTPIVGV